MLDDCLKMFLNSKLLNNCDSCSRSRNSYFLYDCEYMNFYRKINYHCICQRTTIIDGHVYTKYLEKERI